MPYFKRTETTALVKHVFCFVCSLGALGTIALSLTACISEPDGVRYTVPVGAGGGNHAPAQPNNAPASAPMAPPVAPIANQ